MMEKLFEALRSLHPGCELVDIRFSTSGDTPVPPMAVEDYDAALAHAVLNARDLDVAAISAAH